MSYRTKSKNVCAQQMSARMRDAIRKWLGDSAWFYGSNAEGEMYVQTERGGVPVATGDWVVRFDDGTIKVLTDGEFREEFEWNPNDGDEPARP